MPPIWRTTAAVIAPATVAADAAPRPSAHSDRPRQPPQVGRIRDRRREDAAIDRRPDVVAVRGAGADALAFEGTGHQRLERRMRVEQSVNGEDGGDGAGGVAAEAARQRQPLANG